ncbi:uncharacterized protein LOC585829 isoform X2 [Strongylocentrotus purpuratus]|uniref:CUB domain-containing protein n=1 Tax=Strongylocentrotus purpuratus TaxID=7668 RepID=A0A7M7HDT9_STRPU|nr:uncharacterized protein LOC585829 isoform X2 [Strongylocentrotus purpuratus]|eukprot:XP_011665936.1 PREDICTED: uncharacterized protein LOC585829 isoform X2 [Strongylocentrotus purpuratus]
MGRTKPFGIIWIIILALSSWAAAQTAFKPECAAWDQMIRSISRNVRKIPTASATCTRSKDCTRFACKFLMLRKDIIFDIKLFPCTTPAQMRLLVLSNTDNVYFEQTVMNGNTYPIPGLTYNIFPGMRLQISVQVHFRKLAAGLEIGLRMKFSGPTPLITFQYPIFPDFIIPVRECTTAVIPAQVHCTKMNSTVTSLTLPRAHTCAMATGCGGISCSGTIFSVPSVRSGNIPYNISLVMDGCDSPLSYTVAISTAVGSWQYKFFRSKDIIVDMIFPQRTAFVKMAMKPDLNLETMTTSFIVRSCINRMSCFDIGLLNQVAIPIPPCNSVAPTGSSPAAPGSTPHQDECLIWRNVETELIQSAGPGYGITSCTTIENCSGYNCTGEFEGHNYTIVTVLKHCRDPVVLHMRVSSTTDRFFWQKSITHNENITVAGSSGMLGFHIHLLKLSPKQVLVGVFAQVGLPGLSPLNVPLIQDQIMPVRQCPGITNGIPGQGANGRGTGNNAGGGQGGGRPRRPGGRPTKSPVQNMRMRAGASVGIGLSIGVGIAALMATVMIYVYYRQFPTQDRIILVHRSPAPPTTTRTL